MIATIDEWEKNRMRVDFISSVHAIIEFSKKILRVISFSSDHKSYESTGSDLIKIFISEHAAVKVSSVRESWDIMSFV